MFGRRIPSLQTGGGSSPKKNVTGDNALTPVLGSVVMKFVMVVLSAVSVDIMY